MLNCWLQSVCYILELKMEQQLKKKSIYILHNNKLLFILYLNPILHYYLNPVPHYYLNQILHYYLNPILQYYLNPILNYYLK